MSNNPTVACPYCDTPLEVRGEVMPYWWCQACRVALEDPPIASWIGDSNDDDGNNN
jgi:hypothetical protein